MNRGSKSPFRASDRKAFEQLLRNALAHREALRHLHAQALARLWRTVVHLQQGHAHRTVVHTRVVQEGFAHVHVHRRGRGQLRIAQQEAAGR